MHVLVTGASGLVGSNLVRLLLDRGHRVRALVHRDRRMLEGLDLDVVQGDVRAPASLRSACAEVEAMTNRSCSLTNSGGAIKLPE